MCERAHTHTFLLFVDWEESLTSMASALPAPTPSPFLYCSEEKTKKKDRDWSRKTSRTMEALNTCLCLQLELGSCFRRGINRIPFQLTSGSKINQRIGLAMARTPVDGAPPSKETIETLITDEYTPPVTSQTGQRGAEREKCCDDREWCEDNSFIYLKEQQWLFRSSSSWSRQPGDVAVGECWQVLAGVSGVAKCQSRVVGCH